MNTRLIHAVVPAAVVAGAILLLGVVFFFNPATTAFYPRCVFHELSGWYCPGCGSTRAVHALLQGHFIEAFMRNPLLFLLLPILILGVIKPARLSAIRPMWLWLLAGVIIMFALVRNIPAYPFTWLAP